MNWQLGIALYAAGISTLVLIWRLVEFYIEKVGRIRVEVSYITQVPVYNTSEWGVPQYCLSVTVTNLSKHRRSIDKPSLQTDIKIGGLNRFAYIDFTGNTSYPIALDPGDKKEINYNKEILHDKFKKSDVKRVRFLIKDTLGKSYHSKWISI
jgi:hypothetical protein